jgi:hypothetical protein
MTEYDNTNSGALFKNDKKDGTPETDKWPDYTGSLNVGGVEYWINGWIKTSNKTRKKFMSLSVKLKEQTQHSGRDYVQPKGSHPEMDDEVPF